MIPPCTTGINGSHTWDERRERCVTCGLVPTSRPLSRNSGHRRAIPVRRALIRRDGKWCRYCGRESDQLTIEHLIPRARGGTGTLSNLGLACLTCNNVKGNLTEQEFLYWLLFGEIPFGEEYVELHRIYKHLRPKREPLKAKYLELTDGKQEKQAARRVLGADRERVPDVRANAGEVPAEPAFGGET